MSPIGALALFALWTSPAQATPPDIFHSDIRPVCQGPRGVAVTMTTHFNQGSHYISDTQWRLALVEPGKNSVTYVDQGGVELDWIDVDPGVPERVKPKRAWRPSGAHFGKGNRTGSFPPEGNSVKEVRHFCRICGLSFNTEPQWKHIS